MLEKEALDVVSVATPDDHHTEPVCDASNVGVRAVFCEKPICISLKDADRMIETVERNGTKMSVDHTRSFVPVVQEVRRQIRDGAIGGLTRMVQHMGGRRSMLFRNGTHAVDLVCFFADADPVWVIAAHEQGFENYGPEYKGEGGKDPRLDPGSTVIIEFANGVRGILNSAKMTPQFSEIDLQGPGGRYLISDAAGVRAWKTDEPEGRLTESPAPQAESRPAFLGDTLIPAVQELAQMVWNDAPSSSPPQRARNTLEILTGALVSPISGQRQGAPATAKGLAGVGSGPFQSPRHSVVAPSGSGHPNTRCIANRAEQALPLRCGLRRPCARAGGRYTRESSLLNS